MGNSMFPLRHLARRKRNRGIAAMEFGLLAPVFVIVLAGVVDLGGAYVSQSMLNSVVSSAANYALINASSVGSTNGATLASNVAAIMANSNGTAWADATVSVNDGPSVAITSGTTSSSGTAGNADSCYCPSGNPSSWTWGSAVACGTACASGGVKAGKFVVITANYSFTPLISGYGFIPSGKLQASAAVQTQ
jgi:Flp pilus assembly protein TadG